MHSSYVNTFVSVVNKELTHEDNDTHKRVSYDSDSVVIKQDRSLP